MKRSLFSLSTFVIAAFLLPSSLFAWDDAYDKMAKELTDISISTTVAQPKVALIPFNYLDKRKSDGGVIVSERLTTRIVKQKKFKVIERQLLENVLQELHLETTGVVDMETTKKIGKVLGVEAIITGTLMDTSGSNVEVNARLINTETAEVLSSSSKEVEKNWTDNGSVVVQQTQQPQQQQQTYSEPAQTSTSQPKRSGGIGKFDTYIDLYVGAMSGKSNLVFKNSSANISPGAVGIYFDNSALNSLSYRKFEFKDTETSGSMPFGFRAVGFAQYVGFAFEMSYFSTKLKKQLASVTVNDAATTNLRLNVDDYMNIKVFTLLSGDLMVRFSKQKIQPYIGLGLGMTMNTIDMPYVAGYTDGVFKKPYNSTEIGFMFRIPVGVRVELSKNFGMFAEVRPTYNTFNFTRGIKNETDSVTMNMTMMLVGASFRLQ